MPKVLVEMSMSLDGFVVGADISRETPMGRSSETPHEWMFDGRSATESHDFGTNHFSSIGP
jgi:hypothetical protein